MILDKKLIRKEMMSLKMAITNLNAVWPVISKTDKSWIWGKAAADACFTPSRSMHWTMLTWGIQRAFTLKKAADSTCANSNCWKVGRYDQFNSFNKLSPPYARSSLFSLGFTSVSLFLIVCVCAHESGNAACVRMFVHSAICEQFLIELSQQVKMCSCGWWE